MVEMNWGILKVTPFEMFAANSCQRKVRHETNSAAKRSARRLQGQSLKKEKLHTYQCQVCFGYHVGHDKKKGV